MQTTNFLQRLAERCHEHFGEQCDQLTIVFPNKRAGIYFAKYLSRCFDQPVWSPSIYSFEEFVSIKQSYLLADELQLNLRLYEAYKKLVSHPESFDAFMPWGEMILKDFNDIDNYLVEPSHIFQIIKSQKELDESFQFLSEVELKIIQRFWQGFLPSPSAKQSEFIKTWSILGPLYKAFNAKLEESNLTYKGNMIRRYSENPEELPEPIWFAGFNALTAAEESIIKHYLQKEGNDIFWDLDDYYFQDVNQESGIFFREYAQDSVFARSIDRDRIATLNQPDKVINVTQATMATGQVLSAVNLLGNESKDTLVVMADEKLLPLFLEHLPEQNDGLNITMGWPLKKSKVFLFLKSLLSMKAKQYRPGFSAFGYEEVMELLQFGDWIDIETKAIENCKKEAIAKNKLFYKVSDVVDLIPAIKPILEVDNVLAFIQTFLCFIEELAERELPELERNCLGRIYADIKHLAGTLKDNNAALTFISLQKVIEKMGQSGRVPLSGDVNEGLQVMGILETRNLCYDRVMIVGMNEGTWPKASSSTSFIPYNVRKAFDLPTYEHQDAMYAYLFYRLIQHAQQVDLIYNNVTAFNQNGEMSRFVQQLQHESILDIHVQQASSLISTSSGQSIVVQKDEQVMSDLSSYLDSSRQLSPSSLNTYLECRLRFFFQYVKRLKEPDELIEDIDPALMGNLLHGTMEHLYQEKGLFDSQRIEQLKPKVDEAILATFVKEKLPVGDNETPIGRQAIAYEVVKRYVGAILAFDMKYEAFEVVDLEGEYQIPIEIAGNKVTLKGIIDRVDRVGDELRIIDYKSGRDERIFKDINSLFDREESQRNKAVFQLFYYAELYLHNHDVQGAVSLGMFNSKDLFDKDFDARIYQNGRPNKVVNNYLDYRTAYVDHLGQLINEIFDTKVPFDQTDDLKKCEYCPYRQICMRA